MCNTVKTKTGTKFHRDTMPCVLENANLVINPNWAADAFNNYIPEILEKLKLQDVHTDSGISYIMSHNSNHYPFMMVVPVMEAELIGTTDSLKNKNSSGYVISNKIRRLGGHLISKPLSYISTNGFLWLFFWQKTQVCYYKATT